jgi:hypothetical protein
VRYCPVCDAFEAVGRRIAVLGRSDAAISKAKFLRNYSKDVTLLWQRSSGPDDPKDLVGAGFDVATGSANSSSMTRRYWPRRMKVRKPSTCFIQP